MDSIISGNEASANAVVVAPAGRRADVAMAWQGAVGNVVYADENPASSAKWKRLALLTGAGAAAFALAYAFAPGDSGVAVVEAASGVRARPAMPRPRAGESAPALTPVARSEIALPAAADPFVGASFVPPPPPAAVAPPPPPPPAPKAPPLPFSFVGLLEKGAGPKPAAFLARGDALLVVSAGDTVESDYRIESLSATEVVITYLPLNERQRLLISGAKP